MKEVLTVLEVANLLRRLMGLWFTKMLKRAASFRHYRSEVSGVVPVFRIPHQWDPATRRMDEPRYAELSRDFLAL
jgi:hypothetical protein